MRTASLSTCIVASVVLVACGPAPVELPPRGELNGQPFADAGINTTGRVRSPITLDGRGSFDPDGQIVAYRWSVVMSPLPTPDVLADASAPVATLTPDEVGTYMVLLEVEDDRGGTATSTVTLTVTPPVVTVDAGVSGTTPWMRPARLAGTLSVEPGFTVTPEWRILGRPAGSTATLTDATTLTPSFFPDVAGTYTCALVGRTEFGPAGDIIEDTVAIEAIPQWQPLSSYNSLITYSRSLDLFVILETNPAAVVLHDPATGTRRSIAVPEFAYPAMALELSGRRVAIAAFSDVAIVDLVTGTVEVIPQDYPPLRDLIAFDGAQRLHTPSLYSGDPLLTLDLTTRAVTTTTGFGQTQGQRDVILVHPSGSPMYVLDASGRALGRYDISASPVLERQLAYTGPYDLRRPLSITEDGTSLITGSGTVFHASAAAALDMTVRGQLSTTAEASAHSSVTHEIATLSDVLNVQQTLIGTRFTLSSDTTFLPRLSVPVPPHEGSFVVAKLVAYRADGGAIYIVVYGGGGVVFHTATPP